MTIGVWRFKRKPIIRHLFPIRHVLGGSRSRLRGVSTWLRITCWVLGVGLLPIDSSSAATLRVTVEGVRNSPQPVRVLLFNSPDSFPDEEQRFKVLPTEAAQGVAVVEFTDLDPGTYAIMAYHDENANNRLDRTLGMWPSEGYGLSLNPLILGPPAFQESAFELPPRGLSLTISLQY